MPQILADLNYLLLIASLYYKKKLDGTAHTITSAKAQQSSFIHSTSILNQTHSRVTIIIPQNVTVIRGTCSPT